MLRLEMISQAIAVLLEELHVHYGTVVRSLFYFFCINNIIIDIK